MVIIVCKNIFILEVVIRVFAAAEAKNGFGIMIDIVQRACYYR